MHNVSLVIDGNEISGWEEVDFTKSIEALCSRFSLTTTFEDPFPIRPSTSAQLYVDGKQVLNGYIDDVNERVESEQSIVRINGRDKTQDLIDASAVHPSQEFKDISFESLIQKISDPFGIQAIFNVSDLGSFRKFSLQQETAFEAIERAARLKGVFVNSTPEGNLIVDQYGSKRSSTSLKMGENIEAYNKISSFSERFSEYLVRGQQQGTDDINGESAASPEGRAQDSEVTRHRPLIVLAEGNIDNASAKERAEWEASVRKARSVEYSITVTGWAEREGGPLWNVNTIVPVSFAERGIQEDMLITEVTYSLNGSSGHTTTLRLANKNAYQLQPAQEQ